MTKTMFRAALAAATMLAGSAVMLPMVAEAQVGQASLRGRITSPSSNAAQEVTIVETGTNYRRSVPIAADGSYNFASLRAGTYRLEIRLQNGTRNSDAFTLRVGQNAGLDIDLTAAPAATPGTPDQADAEPGATPEGNAQGGGTQTSGDDIIVTGSRIRSLSGGQVGINITQRLIEQLPQNSRNFLAFADLAPGVRFLEEADGSARIQGGAQRSNSVNVFIDGISQKDYVLKNGITGQDSSAGNPFPQLAIGEYQVLSSNYKAEFDQVSSVAITATTKSGTNEFHGEGFFDYTDQNLRNKRPSEIYPNSVDKVRTTDKQYGIALGGPIIKDVMHFFASYEGKRRELPVDIRPENGVLASSLPSQYQNLFGTFQTTFNEDLVFGKIDIVPTDADLIEFTGKYRNETGFQLGNGSNTLSTGNNQRVKEKRGTARWQHTADNWINDFRVAYEDVRWAPTPAVFGDGQLFVATRQNGTSVSRFNIFTTGGGGNYQDKGQRGWTVQDDFTWTGFDRHTIKVGAKARFIKLRTLEQNRLNPLYYYDTNLFSQTGFNDTLPYRVDFGAQGSFGTPIVQSNNFQFGIYAQDDWDVTDRLTLNLGLRWDYERTPAYLDFVTPQSNLDAVSAANYPNLTNADYNINDYISTGNNRKAFKGAFQPRIGFTYRFDEAGRFTMFGGYGRSYDRNQFDFLQQELSFGAFPVRSFQFQGNNSFEPCSPSATCIPYDPSYLTAEGRARLAANAVGGGRELRFINNDLKVPYSDQFSLGFRTRFNPVELEVGYTHISSRDGFVFLLGNRRPDGSFFFNDPNDPNDAPNSPFGFAPPGYGSIIIGTNGLKTNSDAAYVKLTKTYKAASPWSLDATYTYTQAEENRQFGETFSLDFPSINDYPFLPSAGVPRHRFVTAGSVDTPLGLTLSAKFQIESPLYQVAYLSTSSPFQRQVIGSFRNGNGDRWGRRQLDFAATKYIPLHFISDATRVRLRVDIINLMNDRNYVDFNNDPGDTTRTADSPTVYGERVGYSIGGNPPRTIKLSAGFSF
ncbi:membrane protein [Sphingomonas metalli]|uniref:Membrane protein n=1 Tax=Sphingomonas metalli TaxID=1779358 RepID=A0A916T403_9SPHN|nr:TonB-dependent receptor [Sphingomonas metalli]GGB29619.1 membrane protein [Sphingomonas metalli]